MDSKTRRYTEDLLVLGMRALIAVCRLLREKLAASCSWSEFVSSNFQRQAKNPHWRLFRTSQPGIVKKCGLATSEVDPVTRQGSRMAPPLLLGSICSGWRRQVRGERSIGCVFPSKSEIHTLPRIASRQYVHRLGFWNLSTNNLCHLSGSPHEIEKNPRTDSKSRAFRGPRSRAEMIEMSQRN